MDEENRNGQNKRKSTDLAEMLKKGRNGRGRQNLLGKKLSYRDCLPIKLEQKGNDQPLSFDLNQMPHLSITGGTSGCQAAVIRQILKSWENSPEIQPVVTDLAGILDPEKPGISEADFIRKLHEMTDLLERRYEKLAALKLKNTRDYLEQGHSDMPFHPIIIFGFEKTVGSEFRNDAERLISKLAQKGRTAGIDLILCSADAIDPILDCQFPAKLTFRGNDGKDFSLEKPFD